MKALAAALMIGLMMFASSAGAQGVLNQLGGWRGGSTHEAVRPEVACKRFETTLEMRNIDAWGAFEVVPDRPPVRADLAEAALQRLGGTRLVMAADAALLRKDLVEAGRDDVRRIVRNARLGSPAAVTIDGDTIRFRPRDGIDAAAISSAFATLTEGPVPQLASPNIADQIVAGGVVTFTVPDQAVEERRRRGLHVSMRLVEHRLGMLGNESPLVRDLGDGRILVVIPGLQDPDQLLQLVPSRARLAFRAADLRAEPCDPSGSPSPEVEVLGSVGHKGSLVVQKRVAVAGDDVAVAMVVRKPGTDEHAVVLQFSANGNRRLTEFAKENVGQALAFVLDDEIIAAPVIREPITGAAVVLTGGLNFDRARDLVWLVYAAAWPAPLAVVEKQIVAPGSR